MEFELKHYKDVAYAACLPEGGPMLAEADSLDAVAFCGENDAPRLLLRADDLPDAFYQLRTGLAGALMLKFTNYRVRVALLLPAEQANQGRFGEMVSEINRGNQFRVFQAEQEALVWLTRE